MSKANLVKDVNEVVFSKDGIIIRKHIAGLEGGRVLNTDGYTADVFPCGLPVASKTTEGVTDYKPVVPTAEGFTLPDGYEYRGIAAATVRKDQGCPVMISGVVNQTAMLDSLKEVYSLETLAASTLNDLKTACPHLIFEADEVS